MADVNGTNWEALKKEIIDEIRKDSLKEGVLHGLKKSTWVDAVREFLKHPAALVLLTFACTSFLGSWLTSNWQSREKALDAKYQITDQINKVFEEYATAAQDILGLYTYEEKAKNREQVEIERWTYWQQKSRDWRVFSNVLLQKLKFNFTNGDIKKAFEQIIETQYQVSVEIKNLKETVDEGGWEALRQDDCKTRMTNLRIAINSSKDKMGDLLGLMLKEIREE
jgi:hypothetical protein